AAIMRVGGQQPALWSKGHAIGFIKIRNFFAGTPTAQHRIRLDIYAPSLTLLILFAGWLGGSGVGCRRLFGLGLSWLRLICGLRSRRRRFLALLFLLLLWCRVNRTEQGETERRYDKKCRE